MFGLIQEQIQFSTYGIDSQEIGRKRLSTKIIQSETLHFLEISIIGGLARVIHLLDKYILENDIESKHTLKVHILTILSQRITTTITIVLLLQMMQQSIQTQLKQSQTLYIFHELALSILLVNIFHSKIHLSVENTNLQEHMFTA